jgi:hypothetical protein
MALLSKSTPRKNRKLTGQNMKTYGSYKRRLAKKAKKLGKLTSSTKRKTRKYARFKKRLDQAYGKFTYKD